MVPADDFAITAYPNPVKGIVTVDIRGAQHDDARATLTDITGKPVSEIAVRNHKFNIDLSGLPGGIYLLRYTDALHTQTIKINKQ